MEVRFREQRVELRTLTVDRAGTFNDDILLIDREEESPVTIVESGIAREWDGIDRVVIGATPLPRRMAEGARWSVMLLRSSTVPMRKVPAGTRTVPPPSAWQASIAACTAVVFNEMRSPFAPKAVMS